MAIEEMLGKHGVTQAEMAAALGMEPPTLNRKIHGRRPWTIDEANAALAFLRERCRRPRLKLDDLFGSEAA